MCEVNNYVFFHSGPFSQWHSSKFKANSVVASENELDVDIKEFVCCEQYMMCEKALLFNDINIYNKILLEKSPRQIKILGRKVKHFNEKQWKKWREAIVINGNFHKFTQNERLKRKLLNTGDKIIVEAAPNDRIWGVGLKASDPKIKDPSNWKGLNLLGKCLMNVREKIVEYEENNDLDESKI